MIYFYILAIKKIYPYRYLSAYYKKKFIFITLKINKMKKLNPGLFLLTLIAFIIVMAFKNSAPVSKNAGTAAVNGENKMNKAAPTACPTLYALMLTGSFGSPVPAGLQSFIYKVDLCINPVSFTPVSQIKIGATAVTDVTGICDMPGVANYAWAVTGRNSNFPQKLLRVQISTGAASVAGATTVPLQDIENYGSTGLFVAIKEATSQLMKVTVPSGACAVFAPAGPPAQYNGLTVAGTKFQAISGITNTVCPGKSGDIFEYPNTGGAYTAKYSYKNLPANSSWTMKELGFYFDPCCNKRWVVGSSSSVLSHQTNATPCVASNPVFLLGTRAIYDFMVKP